MRVYSDHGNFERFIFSYLLARNWGLDDTARVDISQIELSALMAALVGVPFPTSSVGALPMQYLSGHAHTLAEIALCRAKQMAQTMLTQLDYVREHVVHMYLWHFDGLDKDAVEEKIQAVEGLIKNEKYEEAVGKSRTLFGSSVCGLRYYQVYHRSFIYMCVGVSFVGWLIVLACFILTNGQMMVGRSHQTPAKKSMLGVGCVLILIFMILMFYQVQWSYYIYSLTPIITCCMVKSYYRPVFEFFTSLTLSSKQELLKKSLFAIFSMLSIYVFVICMYSRPVISYVLAALSIMPHFTESRKNKVLCTTWMILCFTIAAFPLRREIVYESSDKLKVFSGSICATVACLCIFILQKRTVTVKPHSHLTIVSMFVPFSMGLLCFFKSSAFSRHFTYFFIVLSWIVPYFSQTSIPERILNVYAWQMSVYVLLSQSFDVLFFVNFCTLLYTWFLLERDSAIVTVDNFPNLPSQSKHCKCSYF